MPQTPTQDQIKARQRADSIRASFGGRLRRLGQEDEKPGLVTRLVDALLRAGARSQERRAREDSIQAERRDRGEELEDDTRSEGGFLRFLRGR